MSHREGSRDVLRTDHSRFVRRGAIHWHVQTMGSGPPLLLVHGTGSSSHSFSSLMPLLAERFTVVAPDLPGHALSHAPSWFEPSLPSTSAAVEELLAALDLRPVVAVGHSAGAAVVARMALDRSIQPRLVVGLGAALVPFSGLARAVFPSAARVLATASRIFPIKMQREDSVRRMLESTGSMLDARSVALYRQLSSRPRHVAAVLAMMASWNIDALHEELPTLETPTLLVVGRRDRAAPVAQQRGSAMRIPHAEVVVVEGAGHLVHEEQPRAVARLLLGASEEVVRVQ